ncbi:MAG: RNA 2',3'-cyclic phosphodiesterase [Deltaproteobacteria bacterium]|jgi:2'-5' RNA ligase|nr:RNA 2',3'-cyclic phosphodiesterase [Deltaproteobacteria bacterium]MDX9760626.1 RNA 2',3'-cyclic phosphodiesterase [Desulfomonilia bacterium]
MIRTFAAIDLPEEIKADLAFVIADLSRKNDRVRWVKPAGMHLTLKFLGDIPEQVVVPLSAELGAVARDFAPLSLAVEGLGAFPNPRRPRVVWAGLSGDLEPLRKLASRVDKACASFGVKPEKRPFQAHITIGRLKIPTVVDLNKELRKKGFSATEIVLYQSELLPTGARYTVLNRSILGHKGE